LALGLVKDRLWRPRAAALRAVLDKAEGQSKLASKGFKALSGEARLDRRLSAPFHARLGY